MTLSPKPKRPLFRKPSAKRLARFLNKFRFIESGRVSYAQCGEDLIVDNVFGALGRPLTSYVDIGAHHPVAFSNTYYFYRRGVRGVCVEPDPALFAAIQKRRRHDVCLNAGVGVNERRQADFFIMSSRGLNTFSRDEAERMVREEGGEIVKSLPMPLLPISEILSIHCGGHTDFLSLDAEGLDLPILGTLDFSLFRPTVICVETIIYSSNRKVAKIREINELLEAQGYFAYADTFVNTVFVDKNVWDSL